MYVNLGSDNSSSPSLNLSNRFERALLAIGGLYLDLVNLSNRFESGRRNTQEAKDESCRGIYLIDLKARGPTTHFSYMMMGWRIYLIDLKAVYLSLVCQLPAGFENLSNRFERRGYRVGGSQSRRG